MLKGITGLLIFILIASCTVFLSQKVHWSDSEIWAVGLAKVFIEAPLNPSLVYKPLFNLSLQVPYLLTSDNTQLVPYARYLFAFLGLSTLFLTVVIAKKIFSDTVALWTLLVFGGCTLFISQGYKIRSDLLAALLQMGNILFFLHLADRTPPGASLKKTDVFITWILSFSLMLVTPKAIYLYIINGIFIYTYLRAQPYKWKANYLRRCLFGPVAIFSIVILANLDNFLSALSFFSASFNVSSYRPAYWQMESFRFVIDLFKKNPTLIALTLWGAWSWKSWRHDRAFFSVSLAATVSIFFILVHNDRLPFFILSLLCFPMLYWSAALSRCRSSFFKMALILFTTFNAYNYLQEIRTAANNEAQIQALNKLDTYMAGLNYPSSYDGLALLPHNTSRYLFPAPEYSGNKSEVILLMRDPKLQIVFFSNRMTPYLQEVYQTLEDQYFIQIGNGIFARSFAMRSTHQLNPTDRKKICEDYSHQGQVMIYAGKSFLDMRPIETAEACAESLSLPKTPEPFVAFTAFGSLDLYNGLSFAQIFDHRADY